MCPVNHSMSTTDLALKQSFWEPNQEKVYVALVFSWSMLGQKIEKEGTFCSYLESCYLYTVMQCKVSIQMISYSQLVAVMDQPQNHGDYWCKDWWRVNPCYDCTQLLLAGFTYWVKVSWPECPQSITACPQLNMLSSSLSGNPTRR